MATGRLAVVSLVLFLSLFLPEAVFSDDTEYYLVKDLLRNYDRRLRPSSNHTEVLNITFGVALQHIMEVDERNQILITNCWLNQGWVDVRLRWNPAAHSGIEEIRLPVGTIWTPDIILYNNADPMSHISTISTNVIIRYDGNVTWLSTAILKSSCQIVVRDFPFDHQECYLQFASWTYGGRQIDMTQVSEQGDVSVYKRNTEWDLTQFVSKRKLNNFSCCPEPWPDITFTIRISRRPLFYVFNLILPCILISVVAMFGFLVPCDSGEKITTTITTLLSMTVFLLLVIEQLPPSAIALPLIGVYYGLTMTIVSAATIATVVTLNIYYKNDLNTEVPVALKWLFFKVLGPLFLINVQSELHIAKTNGVTWRNASTKRGGEEAALYASSTASAASSNPCGSPYCPCNANVHISQNGTCVGNQFTSQPVSTPLLYCTQEYKPCAGRVAFGAMPITVSPQSAARCPSAGSSMKDNPSINRLQSLRRPGIGGPYMSPVCDCGRDLETQLGHTSAEMRKFYVNNNTGSSNNNNTPCPTVSAVIDGRDSTLDRDNRVGADRFSELGDVLHRISRNIEQQEQRHEDSEKLARVRREWRLVAFILDRCFFWFFILTTSVITCVLFSKSI